MYSYLDNIDITHGFLIVKSYSQLYREFLERNPFKHDWYAIPTIDKTADESDIQYRGTDREALQDYDRGRLAAETAMALLNLEKKCSEGFIFDQSDAEEVFRELPDPEKYELIWARLADYSGQGPSGFVSAGFDPTYFLDDHFSASCDCMLFPRWHGPGNDKTLFLEHFRKLNKHGLFDSAEDASAFLEYYRSFDWTEIGDYAIAEVFIEE